MSKLASHLQVSFKASLDPTVKKKKNCRHTSAAFRMGFTGVYAKSYPRIHSSRRQHLCHVRARGKEAQHMPGADSRDRIRPRAATPWPTCRYVKVGGEGDGVGEQQETSSAASRWAADCTYLILSALQSHYTALELLKQQWFLTVPDTYVVKPWV